MAHHELAGAQTAIGRQREEAENWPSCILSPIYVDAKASAAEAHAAAPPRRHEPAAYEFHTHSKIASRAFRWAPATMRYIQMRELRPMLLADIKKLFIQAPHAQAVVTPHELCWSHCAIDDGRKRCQPELQLGYQNASISRL